MKQDQSLQESDNYVQHLYNTMEEQTDEQEEEGYKAVHDMVQQCIKDEEEEKTSLT